MSLKTSERIRFAATNLLLKEVQLVRQGNRTPPRPFILLASTRFPVEHLIHWLFFSFLFPFWPCPYILQEKGCFCCQSGDTKRLWLSDSWAVITFWRSLVVILFALHLVLCSYSWLYLTVRKHIQRPLIEIRCEAPYQINFLAKKFDFEDPKSHDPNLATPELSWRFFSLHLVFFPFPFFSL